MNQPALISKNNQRETKESLKNCILHSFQYAKAKRGFAVQSGSPAGLWQAIRGLRDTLTFQSIPKDALKNCIHAFFQYAKAKTRFCLGSQN